MSVDPHLPAIDQGHIVLFRPRATLQYCVLLGLVPPQVTVSWLGFWSQAPVHPVRCTDPI
jgi:hypothetical protein